MEKISNIISGIILLVGAILVTIFAIPLLHIPGTYDVVIVRSGSMEPTIPTGALAFFRAQEEYQADQVIAFQIETDNDSKYAVIHRAVEKKENEEGQTVFVTKGDANEVKDAVETPQDNIMGEVFLHVPVAGYMISWMQSVTGKVLLIVVPVVLIIYSYGQTLMHKIKNKKSTKSETKEKVTKEHTE
jgi:signal peptidase